MLPAARPVYRLVGACAHSRDLSPADSSWCVDPDPRCLTHGEQLVHRPWQPQVRPVRGEPAPAAGGPGAVATDGDALAGGRPALGAGVVAEGLSPDRRGRAPALLAVAGRRVAGA